MRPLADALRGTLAALGIGRAVALASTLNAWPEAAKACIGDAAVHTYALRVEGTTLVVAVTSPVLAQELRLRHEELLAELGRRARAGGIDTVRFVPR